VDYLFNCTQTTRPSQHCCCLQDFVLTQESVHTMTNVEAVFYPGTFFLGGVAPRVENTPKALWIYSHCFKIMLKWIKFKEQFSIEQIQLVCMVLVRFDNLY